MIKQLSGVFIILLGLIFATTVVFAQSDDEIAKKYGFTFPVAQLGNCNDISSCKAFCDDPQSHQKCSDFAQKHNVGQTASAKSDEEILKLAKTELGCDSYDACMDYCENENNMDKCSDFASRHDLGGSAADMEQQMSTVKNLLGCASMKACMDFCSNPINTQKCMEVFKQAGFSVEASYSGPGGCDSEASCKLYCEKNPKECGTEVYQSEPPETWCPKVSADCKWDGQNCICGGITPAVQESGEQWCPKAGPDCTWTGTACQCKSEDYTNEGPPAGVDPTAWCQQNPGKCIYQNTGDPQAECAKNGCTYSGNACVCPSSEEKLDFSSQCLSQSCNWDAASKTCSCPTNESVPNPTPGPGDASYECEKLGGTWDGVDCRSKSSDVKGVSTTRSLLQQILDFLLGR